MLSPEERALLTDLQDRMIELLVKKGEASDRQDDAKAAEMQAKIDHLKVECDQLRRSA